METISTLAVQLLGGHLTESQKHYIKATSDEKTEKGGTFLIGHYIINGLRR